MANRVRYDDATAKWFDEKHKKAAFVETTVAKCERCGLFYKPSLGHKCRQEAKT